MSRLRGLERLQSFRLYHFQDIRVAKVAKFETLSFSGCQSCEGFKGCKVSDYHFQDIKVVRVPKVANFESLLFSGYHCCKGCLVSVFIIFRISRFRALRKMQNFILYHFQDIKVARVGKVAKFET